MSQWQGTACEERVQVVRPVVAQNTRGQIMILDAGEEGERAEVRVGGNIGNTVVTLGDPPCRWR